ncbi:MAG TPA: T9SS type A sorting domain-containing protein, partial [Chitinophagaceae bacterium]|nr:T9SS type A sorting domain-containing protein [Chitinophagaceae bacterium]
FWLNNGWLNGVTPLPLKLISFTARKQNSRDVLLEWVTAEEAEVDRFEVELSNGNSAFASGRFDRIGTVHSAGNSMGEQRYQLLDNEPGKSGIRYYRLKIIDKDGTVRYSAVRPVVFSDEVKWQVYPNPTNGLLSLVMQGNDGETATIKLYDASGRVIKQQTQTTTGFVQKVWIDLGDKNIPAGLYLLEVTINDRNQVFRVMKQ